MAWLFLKAHGLVFWAVRSLVGLMGRSVSSFIVTVLAWLGEEFRRWVGLAVWGAVIVLAGKATINYAPPPVKQPLAITVLLLLAIWAIAVQRAAHYTLHNSLRGVRQRMWFRQMAGELKGLRHQLAGSLARATWGTPVERLFAPNRDRAAREDAAERAQREAAAQAAREAAERDELVAAWNADHDPYG